MSQNIKKYYDELKKLFSFDVFLKSFPSYNSKWINTMIPAWSRASNYMLPHFETALYHDNEHVIPNFFWLEFFLHKTYFSLS